MSDLQRARGHAEFPRTLRLFKHNSTEQGLIASHLRDPLAEHLCDPVLDVGCGTGEVAFKGLSRLRVTLLDCSVVPQWVAPGHAVLTEDFWNLSSEDAGRWRTALFSHSLQYLDEDLNELIDQIRSLRLQRIIVVRNSPAPLFHSVREWLTDLGLEANPELDQYPWPRTWTLRAQSSFSSELVCQNWSEFARQFCGVVMDVWPDEAQIATLAGKLATLRKEPRITWEQVIEVIDVV
ncbi:MAG: hypothetical protein AB7Q01_07295 [Gammaproteobacteria bacterium]